MYGKQYEEQPQDFQIIPVVLDAGSGFGQYTWRMSSRFRGWSIKGIDINNEMGIGMQ